MMKIVLLFAAFMVPAALIWAIAFVLCRRSRIKRVSLVLVSYLTIGFYMGGLAIIFIPIWLPGTVAALTLLEWAASRKPT